MITLRVLKGDPNAQDWAEIGQMLADGHTAGIDKPKGLNWTVEWSPNSNVQLKLSSPPAPDRSSTG